MNGTLKRVLLCFQIFAHMSPYQRDPPHTICEVALTSLSLNLYPPAQLCFPQHHQTCLFKCLPLTGT